MLEFLSYTFIQKALVGGAIIALICGMLGPFLVLQRLALLSDGLAHLAFGGIALGLLLQIDPLISSLITVLIGSFMVRWFIKRNVYSDSAIAILLSLGVGLGIIIIGKVRGFDVDLYSYLIGSVLTIRNVDIILAASILLVTIIFYCIFYKDLFYLTFNEEMTRLTHNRIGFVKILYTVLVAVAVVIGIRVVGILLITALIVLPALIALNISKSFKQTVIYSSVCACIAVIGGIVLSYFLDIQPSGAIVVLLFLLYILTHAKIRRRH